MLIYLSKALPPLLYQPGLSVLPLLAALIIRRRRPKLSAIFILISVVRLYALSTPGNTHEKATYSVRLLGSRTRSCNGSRMPEPSGSPTARSWSGSAWQSTARGDGLKVAGTCLNPSASAPSTEPRPRASGPHASKLNPRVGATNFSLRETSSCEPRFGVFLK